MMCVSICKIEINIMQIDSTTNLVVYIYTQMMENQRKKRKDFLTKTIDKQHLEKRKKIVN